MKSLKHLRHAARRMRVDNDLSIDEIAERLGRSRSTVYYWVKDLTLEVRTGRTAQVAGQRRGTAAMKGKYAEARQVAYDDWYCRANELLADTEYRDFTVLYLTEGFRKTRNSVSINNSDPAIVAVAYRFLAKHAERPIEIKLHYHQDQDPQSLASFWGSILGVPAEAVKLAQKSNSSEMRGTKRWTSEYGVLTVRSHDTYLRMRLQALMDVLRLEWAPEYERARKDEA